MLPAGEAVYTRALCEFLAPGKADLLTRALYFETTSTLVSDMLVKVDRASMAHALEVRSPFLDHELAELAAAIPTSWKMRNGQGKRIVFAAWGNRFPPELFHRPKMGFAAPVSSWLRGSMRAFLRDHLNSPSFLNRGLISAEFLAVLMREHDTLRRDHSRWLWALLMLKLWFDSLDQFHSTDSLTVRAA